MDLRFGVKLQSHTMKSMQQSKKELVCFIEYVDHTALKRFTELQSHCAKNGSDHFSCKIIETRPQVSYLYYLHASF